MPAITPSGSRAGRRAFTLVELMLSTAVLSLIILMLITMTNQTAATWQYTSGKIEQFSSARDGFEAVTRQIGQATLNTYYDYYDSSGNPRTAANAGTFTPKNYGRQSELRFISGSMERNNLYFGDSSPALASDANRPRPTHGIFFHAPIGVVDDPTKHQGLEGLLNIWGYYVEFDSDERDRPTFLQTDSSASPYRWRYRLMEFTQPSEKMTTYKKPDDWFKTAINTAATPNAHVLAENIVALIIQPCLSLKDEDELATPPTVPGTALAPSYFLRLDEKEPHPCAQPAAPTAAQRAGDHGRHRRAFSHPPRQGPDQAGLRFGQPLFDQRLLDRRQVQRRPQDAARQSSEEPLQLSRLHEQRRHPRREVEQTIGRIHEGRDVPLLEGYAPSSPQLGEAIAPIFDLQILPKLTGYSALTLL